MVKDITGEVFEMLTVLSYEGKGPARQSLWKVRCECGNEKVVTRGLLIGGQKSCGCLKTASKNSKDHTGKVVKHLTALHPTKELCNGRIIWEWLCVCGSIVYKTPADARRLKNNSCGCVQTESANITHGMSDSLVYKVWAAMKKRCNLPSDKAYPDYGGRGISYDPKWETFSGFWEDMQEGYKEGLTIDRKDVNGDYCKQNCRWLVKCRQPQGTRKRKDKWTSRFKGVALQPSGLWLAQTQKDGDVERAGPFADEEDAARAYDAMVLRLFGEFATTNASIGLL